MTAQRFNFDMQNGSLQTKVDKAHQHFSNQEYNQAAVLYQEIIQENPGLKTGLSIRLAHCLILSANWPLIDAHLIPGIDYLSTSGWLNSLSQGKPVSADNTPIPWYTYPAIEFLEDKISPESVIFEFGAGYSTLWWAKKVKKIISIESDSAWFEEIKQQMPVNAQINLETDEEKYAQFIDAYPDQSFDIIIVDGINRNQCIEQSIHKLKDDGLLIFDNTDACKYDQSIQLLSSQDFKRIDFYGMIPSYTYKNCTSLFFKSTKILETQSLPSEKYSILGKSCMQITSAKTVAIDQQTVNNHEGWTLTTPVAFLIFNRPQTTQRVFNAIRQAKPPKLLVVADGPRPNKQGEAELCHQARDVIQQVDWDCDVLTHYSQDNLGCRQRVSSGLDWVFAQVEEAIILEDDCLPHPSFFRYCEELLEKYRENEKIMMISGDNFQFGRKRSSYSYYFSRYAHVWGWATWRNAWKKYDNSMPQWEELRQSSWLAEILPNEQAAAFWSRNFQGVYDGFDTWDIVWLFTLWQHQGFCILPEVNLVSNIGFGSGTHTKAAASPFANMTVSPMRFPLQHPDQVIQNLEADAFTEKTHFSGAINPMSVQNCKVCGADSYYFASAKILQKYDVKYYQCVNCGFVQTETPYWLKEAYSQAIAPSDIGLLYRNNMMANIASKLLFNYFDHNAKFLDYGGGYGVFTRLMRDQGFDFYWQDQYCQNLFASGFELQEKDRSELLLITAFEVFEHLTDPLEELETLLKLAPSILFSTSLLPDNNPKPDQWWYYAPHEGQHIAIYTRKSLEILADKYNLKLYTDGEFLHLLTPEKNLPDNVFDLIKQGNINASHKPSLLSDDARRVISGLLTHSPALHPSHPVNPLEKQAPIILVDGVFFQLYKTGIARVWKSLLEQWATTEFARHLVVLDRNNTAPKINGICYRTIHAYDYSNTDRDRQLLQQICDEEEAELFISSYYTTPLSTPSVFMAYDMIPEVLGGDLNQLMWREKHRGINHASAFIAISANTANDLQQQFPQISPAAITVAHCGVDPRFSPASPQEIANFKFKYGLQKPYFLLGALGGYKNSILFLRGFAQLATRTGLDIVATGTMPQLPAEWRQLTAGCGFHGLQLTDEELRVAYSGAIALVYPSQYEGFGLPIIEAMACGCPVITCPNASIPEVAGEAAIYVGDQDVAAMNEALCEVQKASVRQRLVEAGLQQAARFSWHSMAQTVSKTLLATIQGLKTEPPEVDHSPPAIFVGAMAPQWRHWLYQACQFLLTQGEIPTEGKVCTSASDLDNYLSLMQPSEKTRLIGYRFWGNLSQKYLAQSHHHHLFLYGDPFKLAAEELSQGKTPFGHILLELWLTQGDGAWLNQSQTCLLNFSQLVERPKPIIREISAFLGLTTTKKTLQELLSVHPLPAPKPASSSKGFGAKSAPRVETLTPAQQLLLTIFLRPSRFIWFSAKEDDYDQRLEELFNATAAEAWQELLQDMTGLLVDHLGDRLGDWLKTAYDHGVVPLRAENPQGAAQLLFTLGEQLRERGQEGEAKPFYQEAVRLNPQGIEAVLALGGLAEAAKNDTEAMTYYQQVLQVAPDNTTALLRLANLNRIQKNFSQAAADLERILRQNPQEQVARYWLVKTLEQAGEMERAKQWFSEEEIELLQNLVDHLSHTGSQAFDEKNYAFAKDCYHLALEINPDNYADYFNLALIATKEKKPQQAIRYYQKSLTLKPEHPETLVNLAALLSQRGEFQQAIALLEQAIKLDDQNSMACHNLAICYVYQGRLAEAAAYANQAVQNSPENALYHSHLLAILSAIQEVSSDDLAQVSQVWYDHHVVAKGLPQFTQHTNTINPDRPLRVGFVSGDFKRHSVSYFIKPIFEHHHPDQIQIYAYAQVEEPDDFTETLKGLCEQWRDTLDLDDAALAAQIQQDQIDILVDLSGHTLLNRLAVFGMKPAPIQATYLGYPATTGLPTIDYWITDHHIHPPETTETAVEEIWRLPRCYVSYSPPPVAPPIGPLPQTQLGVITFGSFNASRKLTPATLHVWSEILKQVPESRLLLKCSDPRYSPQLMIESLLKLGIERQRVIVYRNSPYQDHLNLYNQVDLHLDPMPYTGCTTTCEALWMGVPTLTLAGQKKMERMSATILATVGLDDFIATTPADYIAKAVQLVTRPDYLTLLRQTLRERLQASALLDGEDLTTTLESAFRQMWQRYLSTRKA